MKALLTILFFSTLTATAQEVPMKAYVDEKDRLLQDYLLKYTETEVQANRRFIDAQFAALQDAISKANAANEKRFENVNEFRAQLKDQAGTFITRSELWTSIFAIGGLLFAYMNYISRKKENEKFREGSKDDKIKKTE